MKLTAEDWHRQKPWIDDPNSDIADYVKRVAHPEDYDLEAKLEFFKEHGVVIFEGAIDSALLDLLQEDVKHLIEHAPEYDLLVEHDGIQRPIREFESDTLANVDRLKFCNIQTISRAAAHLSLNRCASSFLSHVFKDSPCLLQSLLFNKGSQQPLHLDYPYVRVQKHLACMAASWIPLEDIHADSGPLAYYCGSQRPEKMPFFDWGNGNIVMDEDAKKTPMDFSNHLYSEMHRLNIKPKVFLPKRGDVLIWHAYLAHEGTSIRNQQLTRKSYVTHYCPLASYPDLHMKPNAITEGHCLRENGGYVFDFPWVTNPNRLPSKNMLS
jgi:phytanoyl-CoA hydroxylase